MIDEAELRQWAEKRADDAGRLARELLAQRARVARLENLLKECADDLEAEFSHKYRMSDGTIHPAQQRDFDRDMDLVVRARAALKDAPQ